MPRSIVSTSTAPSQGLPVYDWVGTQKGRGSKLGATRGPAPQAVFNTRSAPRHKGCKLLRVFRAKIQHSGLIATLRKAGRGLVEKWKANHWKKRKDLGQSLTQTATFDTAPGSSTAPQAPPVPLPRRSKNYPPAPQQRPSPVPLPRRSKNYPPAPSQQMPPPQQQQPPADKSSTPLSTGPLSPEVPHSAVQQEEAATAEPVAMDTELSCTSPGLDSGSLDAMRFMSGLYSARKVNIGKLSCPAEYKGDEEKEELWETLLSACVIYIT